MTYSLSRDFHINLTGLSTAFQGLKSPECILNNEHGEFLFSDRRGGITHISPGGATRLIVGKTASGDLIHSNGIALRENGKVLIAHLGDTEGGVYELGSTGPATPLITSLEGKTLPPTNFVLEDAAGNVWFTVSTRQIPRSHAWYPDQTDGYIGIHNAQGTRILADNLGYTNEIAFSPDGHFLYVNETHARRLTRYRLRPGPSLSDREMVCSFDPGDQPDGISFDAEGGAWVTCLVSNKVFVIRPDGTRQLVLSDTDADHVAQYIDDMNSRSLTRNSIWSCGKSALGNVSSICFGGPDRQTAYLGSLLGERVLTFPSPVPGAAPSHWRRQFIL